ncbi:hypothetical protein C8N43_3370 [Litoreibacter ponti]|uniref:Pyridoxamine 5'-phosphate oxidase N-terminal domain-containing protein n=1 Tax=Litoreibacter ponti TaxID=1510457 RepID=A0A2T6BES8_9RHOB|nr:pyridoxamine 5'-phosphate oxidase family protein [Litoreibacter ponti]PTX54554.1 hypothetical protein C8N43_3370 [Litoreibacter ponti]
MPQIDSIEALEARYGAVNPKSLTKVARKMTPLYRQWIEASRFVVLSTIGPEGTDGSPRGDDGPVVHIADAQTLHLPDWMGNNRLDSLRNIVRDGRVSLMFMVPGCTNVVRVNGRARLHDDAELLAAFDKGGKRPATVIVVTLEEMYFQCAKAILRSKIWSGDDESAKVPTAGQFIKEMERDFDAESYDTGYEDYAKPRMW